VLRLTPHEKNTSNLVCVAERKAIVTWRTVPEGEENSLSKCLQQRTILSQGNIVIVWAPVGAFLGDPEDEDVFKPSRI
jgi:hypothetical protein